MIRLPSLESDVVGVVLAALVFAATVDLGHEGADEDEGENCENRTEDHGNSCDGLCEMISLG